MAKKVILQNIVFFGVLGKKLIREVEEARRCQKTVRGDWRVPRPLHESRLRERQSSSPEPGTRVVPSSSESR